MINITYPFLMNAITVLWLLARACCAGKRKGICWKRELQLLPVYICIVVVARFTCFPFSKVNGQIQPLVFDAARAYPFRINWKPFVYLFDYPTMGEALRNLIGNTAMFLPLGIVWPAAFRQLDSGKKTIAAGFGFSLCIELLQLPFYDRVSDIDDLILNTLGFVMGYGMYVLIKRLRKK